MNIDNTTFVEYNSRIETTILFYFIEIYEYDDFLSIMIDDVNIRCLKLNVKLYDTSNDGTYVKYLIIYKVY